MLHYKKYRWMYTSSGKLVIGGKNAMQNEEVVKWLINEAGKQRDYIVMHTSAPGSPFAVLISDRYDDQDLEECAAFCACFSRAWREMRKTAEVHLFSSNQIFKKKEMNEGSFGVSGGITIKMAGMKLCFEVQKGILRAVPYRKGMKSCLLSILPGKISKEQAAGEIAEITGFKMQEVLEALPSGGFKIEKCK